MSGFEIKTFPVKGPLGTVPIVSLNKSPRSKPSTNQTRKQNSLDVKKVSPVLQFSKSIHESILQGRSKNSKHINWAFNLSVLAKQSKNNETKLALKKLSEELRYHPFDSVEKLNIDNSINKLISEITESIKSNPSSQPIEELNNLNAFFEHRSEEIRNLRTKI